MSSFFDKIKMLCWSKQQSISILQRFKLFWQTLGLLVLLSTASAALAASYKFDNARSTQNSAYSLEGSSTCDEPSDNKTPLQIDASLTEGHLISFTVLKQNNNPFDYSGYMYLKVGSYKSYAVTRGKVIRVIKGSREIVFPTHDLDDYDKEQITAPDGSWRGGYPKEFYARFQNYGDENNDGGCSWVGPIKVSKTIQTTTTTGTPTSSVPKNYPPTVDIVYPSNGIILESNFVISANVADDNGIQGCAALLTDKNGNTQKIPMSMGSSTYRCTSTDSVNPLDYNLAEGKLKLQVEVTDSTGKSETTGNSVEFTKLGGCDTRTSSVDSEAPTISLKYPIKTSYRIGSTSNPKMGDDFEYEIEATDNRELQSLFFSIKDSNGNVMYDRNFGIHGTSDTTGRYGFTLKREPENSFEKAWDAGSNYTYFVKVTDMAELCSEQSGTFEIIEPPSEINLTSPQDSIDTYYGLRIPVTGKAIHADGIKTIAISLVGENGELLETKESNTYSSPIEEEFYKDFNPAALGA